MSILFHNRACLRAVLLACIVSVGFFVTLPHSGTAQAARGFTVTVDPFTSCAADAPVTGAVDLVDLATGHEFTVQLQGDGEILDSQSFRGRDDLADGQHEWSVSGASGVSHELLELWFTLRDAEGRLIRDETMEFNPDCQRDPSSPVSSSASPVATMPSGMSVASTRPLVDAGLDGERDAVLVAGFAGATVLVLTALAFLDRRPEP